MNDRNIQAMVTQLYEEVHASLSRNDTKTAEHALSAIKKMYPTKQFINHPQMLAAEGRLYLNKGQNLEDEIQERRDQNVPLNDLDYLFDRMHSFYDHAYVKLSDAQERAVAIFLRTDSYTVDEQLCEPFQDFMGGVLFWRSFVNYANLDCARHDVINALYMGTEYAKDQFCNLNDAFLDNINEYYWFIDYYEEYKDDLSNPELKKYYLTVVNEAKSNLFYIKYSRDKRLFIYFVDKIDENIDCYDTSNLWVFTLDKMPRGLEFPQGHPKANHLYFAHSRYEHVYMPYKEKELAFSDVVDIEEIPTSIEFGPANRDYVPRYTLPSLPWEDTIIVHNLKNDVLDNAELDDFKIPSKEELLKQLRGY